MFQFQKHFTTIFLFFLIWYFIFLYVTFAEDYFVITVFFFSISDPAWGNSSLSPKQVNCLSNWKYHYWTCKSSSIASFLLGFFVRLQYTIIAFIWGEHRKLSTREWLFSQGHVSFLWWGCLLLNDKAYQFQFIICIQFLWWWFGIWMFTIIFINYQLYLDYPNYCGRKTLKIIMNWLMKALILGRRPPRILNTCSGIGLWSHVSDVRTVV